MPPRGAFLGGKRVGSSGYRKGGGFTRVTKYGQYPKVPLGSPPKGGKPKVVGGPGVSVAPKVQPSASQPHVGATKSTPTPNPKTKPAQPGVKTPPKGAGPKSGGKPTTTKTNTSYKVNLNPQKMAETLAGMGYDAEIAAIQQAIARNESLEQHAMDQLTGWGQEVEKQRAASAQAIGDIYEQAVGDYGAAAGNIAALGGGVAGPDAAAYSTPGAGLLAGTGAADEAFMAHMAPILAAQTQDYGRRAAADFRTEREDLRKQLIGQKKERGQAKSAALLDLINQQWQRKMDMLQAQTAQQALAQSAALFPGQLAQQQAETAQAQAGVESARTNVQAEKIALKKAQVELNKLVQNPSGFDMADPNNRAQIGSASLSGALGPKGAFIINPRVAWENAMNALNGLGLGGNQAAVAAAWNAFQISLRLSHTKKMWGEYRVKNGQLIYNPTLKFKKHK